MERLGGGQLPFSVRVDREGDSVLIALFGDLSLGFQAQFEEELRELDREPVSRVLVDLSGLTFMDSTGLFLLLNLWKRCHREGTDIAFEGGSQEIHGLFEATGMDQVLPVISPGARQVGGRRRGSPQLDPRLPGKPPSAVVQTPVVPPRRKHP
jgi:anti-sigma B factor antagonist